MKLIGVKTLDEFKIRHPDITSRLDSWKQEVKEATWLTTHNIKERYATADFFKNSHVVINLKGNKYRLLFQVDYLRGIVLIKKIGTHSEYDSWTLN